MNWSVGITTAPRQRATLPETIKSLALAGWDRPRLFCEPDVTIPPQFRQLPASVRDERLGAFPNWFLALSELLMRYPQADAFLLCQDDVSFCRGIRTYLERVLWPADAIGVVSLFCPSYYGRGKPYGFHREDRGWDTCGAQAYVFPRVSAEVFLTTPQVLAHRRQGPRGGEVNIDSVVGAWCRKVALPYFVHVPSLAQHVGSSSTLYPGAGTFGNRRAADFQGVEWDISKAGDQSERIVEPNR